MTKGTETSNLKLLIEALRLITKYFYALDLEGEAILQHAANALQVLEWQPVVGWEEHYEVSFDGEIRTIDGQLVEQWIGDGYMNATLFNPIKIVSVHRVVAKAFIPNPHNKPMVGHEDNCPWHADGSNLEWCTQKENMDHMVKCNRQRKSRQHSINDCSD